VLELVLLYLGGSLALLFNGPGRFSFDAGIVPTLLDDLGDASTSVAVSAQGAGELQAVAVTVNTSAGG
jgi:putative oxidoreductase